MRGLPVLSLLSLFILPAARAQLQDDDFSIDAGHPRLFLGAKHLQRLRRERERQSIRWQQFENLVAGKAVMPEPGFSHALYFQVAGDREVGRRAVAWALGSASDLRQLALVYDWCQPLLTPAESKALAAKLAQGIAREASVHSVSAVCDRTLAAVALAGESENPQLASRELASVVRDWWEKRTAPLLKQGHSPFQLDDTYPLLELLHAVRDNLNQDLRDFAPRFFKNLPIFILLNYYPASYPAAENEYRIPAARVAAGEPDLHRAALSRAADLAIVAYDSNAPESQVLQGWLMHDHFLMRGAFGLPYEFLWANPYQPGLSYYHVPLVYYDEHFGRLFARSSWEDNATWLGYLDGQLQIFRDGRPSVINLQRAAGPLVLPDAVVFFGGNARKFRVTLKEGDEEVFVVGLKPRQRYEIEVDDEEMQERRTDAGGILTVDLPHKVDVGVRLREAGN
jgi:hypothetical protein